MGNRFLVPTINPGGLTLLSTTTLSGSSVTLSSLPQNYVNLRIYVRNYLPATDAQEIRAQVNGDSAASRYANAGTFSATAQSYGNNYWALTQHNDNAVAIGTSMLELVDYTNTTTAKMILIQSHTVNGTTTSQYNFYSGAGVYNQTGAITSINLFTSSGNFTSGTLLLYGVR
jgi:hypothetical protein